MIRELGVEDVDATLAHVVRLWAEDETVRSRPYGRNTPVELEARAARLRAGWAKTGTEIGWMRTWGLIVDGEIRGHCDLKGGNLASEMHRAALGIAIEDGHRDRGIGKQMCEAAIAWAKEQQLAWIDLGVFSANARAHALYRKLGFVEIGVTRDRFRVDGETIDDISMALAL